MAADDDKDLREVKAVLQGLQRIGTQLPRTEAAGKNPGVAATLESLTHHGDTSRPADRPAARAPLQAGVRSENAKSADGRPVQGKRLAALALAMLAAGTVIVLAGDLFLKYWPSSRQSAAISGDVTSAVVRAESPRTKIVTPELPAEPGQPALQAGTIDDRSASPAFAAAPVNPAIANAQQLMDGGHVAAARELLQRPDLLASQEGAWLLARSYDPNYLATVQSPDASADKRQAEEWYRRWRDIAARNGMVMDDLRLKRIINSMR
jgi:hypothetical protein